MIIEWVIGVVFFIAVVFFINWSKKKDKKKGKWVKTKGRR